MRGGSTATSGDRRPRLVLLMSRATDSRGRVQPMAAHWNPSGYLWNVVDRVRVDVA